MGKKLDITGQRYGKLVALEPTDEYDTHNIKWLFQCACGKQVKIATGRVRRKQGFKSCGCGQWESVQPTGIMGLINYYKKNVRKHGRVWDLTLEQARDLFLGNCKYCGSFPETPYKYEGTVIPTILLRNGIDRVDN